MPTLLRALDEALFCVLHEISPDGVARPRIEAEISTLNPPVTFRVIRRGKQFYVRRDITTIFSGSISDAKLRLSRELQMIAPEATSVSVGGEGVGGAVRYLLKDFRNDSNLPIRMQVGIEALPRLVNIQNIPNIRAALPGENTLTDITDQIDVARILVKSLEHVSKNCHVMQGAIIIAMHTGNTRWVSWSNSARRRINSDEIGQLDFNANHAGVALHPREGVEEILRTSESRGTPLIAVNIEVSRQKNTEMRYHANSLLVNVPQRHVDIFEPHGTARSVVLGTIRKMFHPEFTVTDAGAQCPLGPQTVAHRAGLDKGYCVMWSALYICERILNPTATPGEVMRWLAGQTGQEGVARIRKLYGYLKQQQQCIVRGRLNAENRFLDYRRKLAKHHERVGGGTIMAKYDLKPAKIITKSARKP